MAKSDVLHIRIEPQLRSNVESILAAVGLSSADAVNLFFRQIQFNRGLPFEIKVPEGYNTNAKELFDDVENKSHV